MDMVSVQLNTPWPTAAGLRRPQEGVISVSAAEAEKIKAAKAGKILAQPKAEKAAEADKTDAA